MPVEIEFGLKKEMQDDPKGEKDEEGNVKQISVDVPNIINNTTPTWMLKPADLKDEDYTNFYRELYPMNMEDALFNIHLNVDYPFNLTGILFFPPLKKSMDLQRKQNSPVLKSSIHYRQR